jgi:hypothetical protein
LAEYTGLIKLARPELVPYPGEAAVLAARRLIAQEADVPVLLSALTAKPAWYKPGTAQVAQRTGLTAPVEFFRQLAQGIS